jgi:hypothetical protein
MRAILVATSVSLFFAACAAPRSDGGARAVVGAAVGTASVAATAAIEPVAASAPARAAPIAAPLEVTLVARWDPMASSKYQLAESSPELAALYAAGPAEPERAWSSASFAFLLPPAAAEPGATWLLDARPCLPFLRQFHPGATLDLHHASFGEGAAATLLSASPARFDVLFRVHAEIEAIPGELYYTPAQFEGRLVWDRAAERVLAFELAVPPRDTNVDVNARVDRQILADIGYAPEMSLRLARAAAAVEARDLAEPRRALARALYGGFTAIDWLPFEAATLRARADARPLHVLILFGTLDDESC